MRVYTIITIFFIYLKKFIKEAKISSPETTVPIVDKTFAKTTTNKILVILFFQKPLIDEVSCAISSKSDTFGFLSIASLRPANQPAASKGLKEVSGAIMNAVSIDNGWPRAQATPRALRVPFHRIHDLIWERPTLALLIKE